jgi:hypothetical protein
MGGWPDLNLVFTCPQYGKDVVMEKIDLLIIPLKKNY